MKSFLGNLWDGLVVKPQLMNASRSAFLRLLYQDYRYETPPIMMAAPDTEFNVIQDAFNIYNPLIQNEASINRFLLNHFKKSSLKLQEGVKPIWSSSEMDTVITNIQRVARLDLDVLLTGETGVGKDHLARFLHHLSLRRNGPFVTIDCCAIPESLFEAEVFGHQKGAYTSANEHRKGRIERAQGGTCFLNEIGEIPLNIQAKLLGVIERKSLIRLGGSKEAPLNVRFIFATNRNLKDLVEAKAFREDLFWRIAGFSVEVPPLRSRQEDIPILANHFLEHFSLSFDHSLPTLSSEAWALLMEHPWPGNVRELVHVMKTICTLFPDKVIHPMALQNLLGKITKDKECPPPKMKTKENILDALKTSLGNRREAALRLGVSERTIYRYLKLLP
jgi:transcriptional regulator with PAS, ATPase and Fis domain